MISRISRVGGWCILAAKKRETKELFEKGKPRKIKIMYCHHTERTSLAICLRLLK